MCYEVTAEPPVPVMTMDRGGGPGSARGEELVLTSAVDAASFAAFAAHPSEVTPSRAGIVVLPDVRGLYKFYRELALRFAEVGVQAVAIDYFGRTAGLGPRGDDFDFMAHMQQVKSRQIAGDVASAIAYLRATPGGGTRSVFTVGFCFGGWASFLQAADQRGLAGVIGFYGSPDRQRADSAPLIERVGEFHCPLLGLFGGADQGIPESSTQAFDRALAEAGVPHEIVVYPGAPHSFFDRKQEEFAQESADAWMRVLQFIRANSPEV